MHTAPAERLALIDAQALHVIATCTPDRAGAAAISALLMELLVLHAGAVGGGLRSRLRSVESRLPEPMTRELHYLATVCNDLLHSPSAQVRDPQRFVRVARRNIHALLAMDPHAQPGSTATSAPTPRGAPASQRPPQHTPADNAGTDPVALLQNKLSAKKRLHLGILFTVTIIVAGVALPNPWGFSSLHVLGIACVVSLLAAVNVLNQTWLSQHQYSEIPGSTDARGEHRCVQCGHPGIHRRTIYKTNTTVARCSKCGLEMWAE